MSTVRPKIRKTPARVGRDRVAGRNRYFHGSMGDPTERDAAWARALADARALAGDAALIFDAGVYVAVPTAVFPTSLEHVCKAWYAADHHASHAALAYYDALSRGFRRPLARPRAVRDRRGPDVAATSPATSTRRAPRRRRDVAAQVLSYDGGGNDGFFAVYEPADAATAAPLRRLRRDDAAWARLNLGSAYARIAEVVPKVARCAPETRRNDPSVEAYCANRRRRSRTANSSRGPAN